MSAERRRKSATVATEPGLAEVEELLRAAQDDLLLKLSLNTHTTASSLDPTLSSSSSSSLDPDLSRRFEALRSYPAPAAANREPPVGRSDGRGGGGGGGAATTTSSAAGGEARGWINEDEAEMSRVLGGDLAARFSALKGSSSSHLPAGDVARRPYRIPEEVDDDDSDESDDEGDGGSEKEVEKLMQWAADAARLDPDPGSSDDEEGFGKEGGESERVEEEDVVGARADEKKKEAEGKKPPTRKKWFF